jgi:hypothetical protein
MFKTKHGYTVSSFEAVCIVLARLRAQGTEWQLVRRFDRSQGAISDIFNTTIIMIDDQWHHLLEWDGVLLSPENMARYAAAAYARGAPLKSVWGFIDCTIRQTCRPVVGQQSVYSGYSKSHGLKYQAIMVACGMIAHLAGPWEARQNDGTLLDESGILEWCALHAIQPGSKHGDPPEHRYFQLYGDPAYPDSELLLSPFSRLKASAAEREFNAAMTAKGRICVEHGFAVVAQMWPFLRAWEKHRLLSSPIGIYYRVAVLFTNAHNCFEPNEISNEFNCIPPTLKQYFHN